MNFRMLDGKIQLFDGVGKYRCPLDYYCLSSKSPEATGAKMMDIAKEQKHEFGLTLTYIALKEGLNLAFAWPTIKFLLHEALRIYDVDEPREQVYQYTTAQAIDAVVSFVESFYE